MKKVFTTAFLLIGFMGATFAQESNYVNDCGAITPKVRHWSLLVKGGGHYFRTTTMDVREKHNYNGFVLGAELEYTFNPLFGIGFDYTYNKYNRPFKYNGVQAGKFKAHTNDAVIFGSMNLTNLLGKYRKSQKFNLYVNAGIGAAWYTHAIYSTKPTFETSRDRSSLLLSAGTTAEYHLGKVVSLNLGFKYNYYFKNHISGVKEGNYFASKNDRQFESDDAWVATVGLRFKFGAKKSKQHARNITMCEYYPMKESVVKTVEGKKVDLTPLNKKIADLEAEIKALKEKPAPAPVVIEKFTDVEKQVIKQAFQNVEFDTAKATLRPKSITDLTNVASILNSKTSWSNLVISGHTDNVGSEISNQSLSERRVQAVKNFLVSKGVPTSKIETRAYGETRPIASNATAAGRQQNRRVEVEIND